MTPALILVDLQNDFLSAPALHPSRASICANAVAVLEGFRSHARPVIHAWTTVRRDDDHRMPHWKRADKWACVEGTPGHEPPLELRPRTNETIIHKNFFSAFEDGRLDQILRALGCDTVVVAGVHLYGCIRATVLDAYQRGYAVLVVGDAVASEDPIHAAITRRYLGERAANFEPAALLLSRLAGGSLPSECFVHRSPRDSARVLWEVPIGGRPEVAAATAAAREAGVEWRRLGPESRAAILRRFADSIAASAETLSLQMAEEIGKPVTQALAEVCRGVSLLQDIAGRANEPLQTQSAADSRYRYQPVGVVAVVTPWNNPLAIPVSKIGAALLYGNSVVWKPAPAGTGMAIKLMELLQSSGCPKGIVNIVEGDQTTAQILATDAGIDAVTLSGSLAAGYAMQEICARRHLPFQAELGGNNAAIVWDDANLAEAAASIAEAAFGFAGQRCTANRRVIVSASYHERFITLLESAVASLVWGDPLESATQIGPLISAGKRAQIAALIARITPAAGRVLIPHATSRFMQSDTYHPPVIIVASEPAHEVVQEESFGPVLVVQRANDFEHALVLCNGVRQGLVAALFSSVPRLQERFLNEVRAGILKLNRATADADAQTPFGGWKASGIGPPEHGPADREFHTRTQAIYEHLL